MFLDWCFFACHFNFHLFTLQHNKIAFLQSVKWSERQCILTMLFSQMRKKYANFLRYTHVLILHSLRSSPQVLSRRLRCLILHLFVYVFLRPPTKSRAYEHHFKCGFCMNLSFCVFCYFTCICTCVLYSHLVTCFRLSWFITRKSGTN